LLTAGKKIGIYEIVSSLGAGGMGEVYRARDTKLQRDVALKILPETMARDAQRMARFEREAQVLASLNHPNIAAIHGLEESNGVRALVMELVEGQTLAERLQRVQPLTRPASRDTLSPQAGRGERSKDLTPSPQGRGWSSGAGPGEGSPLAVDDTLPIARQIAEALEYAHERGVIHRDLKPANVKITPEGTVKVLDFGLAKVLDTQDSTATIDMANSPTLSAMATQAGMILGTAAYMSPEQAKGQRVDRRADIWAFGCVLFEMLSGRKPFEGETISEVLASVIKSEPVWDAIPGATPPSIQRLVRRCLVKDPKQRLRDIGEARITIEETMSGTGVPPVVEHGQDAHATEGARRAPLRRALPWVAGLILICLAGVGGFWIQSRRVPSPNRWSGDLLGGSNIAFGPRISPDGRTVAFEAMVDNLTQLAVMSPDSGNWTVLTHDRTHGLIEEIAWSRDGSKLYFDRVDPGLTNIYTVPALGGEERLFLENAFSPAILPDGSMLVARLDAERNTLIFHYWPASGRLQPMDGFLWKIPSGPHDPLRVFPDGREAVFFGTVGAAGGSPNLYALDIPSGKAHLLDPQLSIPASVVAFPMAPTSDNRSVLIDLPSGSLYQVVAVPRSGSGSLQPLMTLTTPAWFMDCGADGSIYVDQVERPLQVLRFPVSGGTPEVLAASDEYPPALMQPVAFSNGSLLIPALLSGHARLLIGKPNGNFFPLVETAEETSPPAALLLGDQVAFILGSDSGRLIAIASVRDGRIIRRLEGSKGKQINSLSTSPDGKDLYFTMEGYAWAIPATDGTPHKIGPGDGVAVSPDGKDLFVNMWSMNGARLFRVALPGDREQEIRLPSDFPNADLPLGGDSVAKDGKLLFGLLWRDSWFYSLGVFEPVSGKLTRIPLNYTGDILVSGWTDEGRILAFGEPMRSRLWRFRPSN
jgi:eukaryotic-like serine/threonine-protein kinase